MPYRAAEVLEQGIRDGIVEPTKAHWTMVAETWYSAEEMEKALAACSKIWVIEQNHGRQLFHYLKSLGAIPGDARSLARPGPLPLRPGEIVDALTEET